MMKQMKSESTVQCPKCGFRSTERMPTDYSLVRYECKNCGYIMTPRKGTCCIFCSFGDVKCPSMQLSESRET